MALTLEQQLDQVQAAITAIETGAQEYWLRERRIRKADLPVLYAREADLMARIAEANGETMKYVQWERV